MKRILIAAAAAALVSLGACAYDGYGPPHHGSGFYEHNAVAYDGFYDDYYGPFYDGYWGEGGFYYSTGEGNPYSLDGGNHFRHEGGTGFHDFHGGMHRGGR